MVRIILRAIAIFVGAILVLGGGICTLMGVPSSFMGLARGLEEGVPVLFATAVGFGLLLLGLCLLKFGGGKSSSAALQMPGMPAPEAMLGKYFLISVNYVDPYKKPLESLQLHGYAEEIIEDGIRVALRGQYQGPFWTVPFAAIRPAQPGAFTIEAPDGVEKDPDFFAHMTVKAEVPTVPAVL